MDERPPRRRKFPGTIDEEPNAKRKTKRISETEAVATRRRKCKIGLVATTTLLASGFGAMTARTIARDHIYTEVGLNAVTVMGAGIFSASVANLWKEHLDK